MKFFMIVPQYIYWHYSAGFVEWTRNLFNFLQFEFHFFSVKQLLLTLFAPFQRLRERYSGSPLDIEALLSVFLVNIIMRLVGFVVRSVLLIFAFITITLSFVLVVILLISWIFLPIILAGLLFFSFVAYFKYRP